jgi:hypothetical protein
VDLPGRRAARLTARKVPTGWRRDGSGPVLDPFAEFSPLVVRAAAAVLGAGQACSRAIAVNASSASASE